MSVRAKCIDLSFDGCGVVKVEGIPIFVPNLLVGEEAEIEITRKQKSFQFGKVKKLYQTSPQRIKPICPVFPICGGCQLQHMDYQSQLNFKKTVAQNNLQRIAGIEIPVRDTIGMAQPLFYRNKVQIPLGKNREGQTIAGFYATNSHLIVPFKTCYIQSEESNSIVQSVLMLMQRYRIPAYDEDKREGVIRHLLIKTTTKSEAVMVVLVCALDSFPGRRQFVVDLRALHPNIVTIVQNINPRKTSVVLGEHERVLYGDGHLIDEMLGLNFVVSPKSFYQVNPLQTEKLYQAALEYAQLQPTDIVLDAYAGVGTIGLLASRSVKAVTCVEIVKEAIQDGRKNAKLNNIKNVEFINDDSVAFLKNNTRTFNVAFVDPPRRGCDAEFINSLIAAKIGRIIYISCSPATLARDFAILKKSYNLEIVQPFDMFPWTQHVETVCALSLKKSC